MQTFELFLEELRALIWNPVMLLFLFSSALFMLVRLRAFPYRYFFKALREIFHQKNDDLTGDISHFAALMTSMAGAIGTGSVTGVATALMIGGSGALVWMWLATLACIPLRYAECTLAIRYRLKDSNQEMIGGPMYYIEKGTQLHFLAVAFALCGTLASLTTGNIVQVNSIVEAMRSLFPLPPLLIGSLLAAITLTVLIGGIRSIGRVSSLVVPVMALFYLLGGLWIIGNNLDKLPSFLLGAIEGAFGMTEVMGGLSGALIAMQIGTARGMFATEAGLGLPSIAAAAAKTDYPARQALISMTAVVFTMIICTITALVIGLGGVFEEAALGNLAGAQLTIESFERYLPFGRLFVAVGLTLFAFTTQLAWAYYGEKSTEYLFGERSIIPFRLFFCFVMIPASLLKMGIAWSLSDVVNGVMTILNVIALLLLTGVVIEETTRFQERVSPPLKEEKKRHG